MSVGLRTSARLAITKPSPAGKAATPAKNATNYFSADQSVQEASQPEYSFSISKLNLTAHGDDPNPRPSAFAGHNRISSDSLEREADDMAAAVLRRPLSSSLQTARSEPVVQRKCECGGTCDKCKQERAAQGSIQKKSDDSLREQSLEQSGVDRIVNTPGEPLERETRLMMEERFGWGFETVRIHADAAAARSARALAAKAYTLGQHIVFSAGRYSPGTAEGRSLLAHELVHTLQQRNINSFPSQLPMSSRGSPAEVNARRTAEETARGDQRGRSHASVMVPRTSAQIARDEDMPELTGDETVVLMKLRFAKDLLRQTYSREVLSGMIDKKMLIDAKTPSSNRLYVVFHPWRDDAPDKRDESIFELNDLKIKPTTARTMIKVDGRQEIGDIALELFANYKKTTGGSDTDVSDKYIGQEDKSKSREEHVKQMVDSVLWKQYELINKKQSFEQIGYKVTTSVPHEKEYDDAFHNVFMAEIAKGKLPADAIGPAKDAAISALNAAIAKEGYAKQFGEAWDKAQTEWERKNPKEAEQVDTKFKTHRAMDALVVLVKAVDPNGPAADSLIDLIDASMELFDTVDMFTFIGRCGESLENLIGPFGFRALQGTGGLASLQWDRVDYALMNFRRLSPKARSALRRDPMAGDQYGIKYDLTEGEHEAEDRIVAIRTLPDGSTHQGTLGEFKVALENNRINHILAQLDQIANAGPGSLVGRIIGGEKGAEIGSMVDAGLMVAAPVKARMDQRRQMAQMTDERLSPRLEPEALRQRATKQDPMPKPDPPKLQPPKIEQTKPPQPPKIDQTTKPPQAPKVDQTAKASQTPKVEPKKANPPQPPPTADTKKAEKKTTAPKQRLVEDETKYKDVKKVRADEKVEKTDTADQKRRSDSGSGKAKGKASARTTATKKAAEPDVDDSSKSQSKGKAAKQTKVAKKTNASDDSTTKADETTAPTKDRVKKAPAKAKSAPKIDPDAEAKKAEAAKRAENKAKITTERKSQSDMTELQIKRLRGLLLQNQIEIGETERSSEPNQEKREKLADLRGEAARLGSEIGKKQAAIAQLAADPLAPIRAYSYSASAERAVLVRAKGIDEYSAFSGQPGKKIQDPSIDHLNSIDEMSNWDGFWELTEDSQKKLVSYEKNLFLMEEPLNSSKSNRTRLTDWKAGVRAYGQDGVKAMTQRKGEVAIEMKKYMTTLPTKTGGKLPLPK
ncbi:hypothetical protein Acid345_0865 [Candidatus Koribacter versatilis Ellin345]|uniref:eCIS core domain-containing protein n=2 Tax=Candidatus Korobacter versatilis TaxID=658062 RepID=Q1ITD0_KORVE|nr:hypothetical protein Acid345_0865 [Candidatus Koribacter versatilis Ellin345]